MSKSTSRRHEKSELGSSGSSHLTPFVWRPQFSPSPTLVTNTACFTAQNEEIEKCGLEQKLDNRRQVKEGSPSKRNAKAQQNEGSETGDSSSLTSTQEWLTTREAADYLGLSTGSLLNMTSNGKIPHYKLGLRRNRYRVADLRELLLAQKRGGSI
jgi:excisionase family DNA binding protein